PESTLSVAKKPPSLPRWVRFTPTGWGCGQNLGLLQEWFMYSYEDRLRAVRLYLKLGRRIKATIRQLGYPTKNSLKAWYREFERTHDLRRGYHREKRQYTDEQKLRAVDH